MTDFEDKKKDPTADDQGSVTDQGEKGGMASYDEDLDIGEDMESNEPTTDVEEDENL